MTDRAPKYVVAVVGGATAGAEAAGMLAARGITAVVFEQNARPYGKIEDGLPRWHVKLRKKEYELIDARLDRPGVHFVPETRIGRDVSFEDLATTWGFSAVVLAHGAWRDRPLPIEGADRYVGKGLLYQNAFIYWFNHFEELGYRGPRYDVPDGAIVVGGGLASIDVVKALQLEGVRRALADRGIDEDVETLEAEGIPAVLAEHGLTWERLGLRGATLYYRRRVEDMPLTEISAGADPAKVEKIEATRRKILHKAMRKYCFAVCPLQLPVALLVEGDRLVGLRFQRTRIEHGEAVPIDGALEDVHAPLVVSSIGSVPEPLTGIGMRDELYQWSDADLGRLPGYESVFSAGNVVTGKGNILASRKHSAAVSAHVIEQFLGLGTDGHAGEERLLAGETAAAKSAAQHIASEVRRGRRLAPAEVDALLGKVRARQEAVAYPGSYRAWIETHRPESASRVG